MAEDDVAMQDSSTNIAEASVHQFRASPIPRGTSLPSQPSPTVAYVYSSEMTLHAPLPDHDHPEKPERLRRIWEVLSQSYVLKRMHRIPIRPMKMYEALLIHSQDHWNRVQEFQYVSDQEIADSEDFYEKLSLYICQHTTRCALLSGGGVIEASLAVARGSMQKSVAIVRPPGHHAEPEMHMGFCFFNNVAIAARVMQQQTAIKKILIVDWDVHHGNGTQKAFYDDPNVLFISIHRYEGGEFYPSGPEGSLSYCGEGAGLGFNINIPWPVAGLGDADYLYAFQKIVMPVAMEFSPELVIISSGFDAAEGDPLGECYITPKGYAHMTHLLAGLAGGKMVVVLEGGYNVDAVANSMLAVTKVVLGEPPEEMPPLVASEAATETVWLVAKEQSKFWKNINPQACEPREDVEPSTHSISDILKAHRYNFMSQAYGMFQIPLVKEELEAHFSNQVLCSSDIFDCSTLVVFVHEFGNLQIELASATSCDANLEKSYLLDFSKEMIEWIRREGYGLLDVNMLKHPTSLQPPLEVRSSKRMKKMTDPDPALELLTYLWDNYIQLSGAKRVVFMGHGPGCIPLINLIDKRFHGITKITKAVVQVTGHSSPSPRVPKKEELRTWYTQHSYVVVPTDHQLLGKDPRSAIQMYGTIVPIEERKPIKLMSAALGGIAEFVQRRVGGKNSSWTTNT